MTALASQMPELRPEGSAVGNRTDDLAERVGAAWIAVRSHLRTKLGTEVFDSWLVQLELGAVGADGRLALSAPTRFLKTWVEAHYLGALREAFAIAGAEIAGVIVRVRPYARVTARPAAAPEQAPAPAAPSIVERRQPRMPLSTGSPLTPRYTFETFVRDHSNELALAAVRQALATPRARRQAMNPIYVFSRVGLGKTHLLQATVAAADDGRAIYLTAERFCGLAHQMRSIAFARALEISAHDIVAIDDIHFLGGRSVRGEFVRLVERLLEEQRQVIVACDRPPEALDFGDARLTSRLSGGLPVEIGPMGDALRRELLRARLADAAAQMPTFSVGEDIVAMVAARVTRDGRDLEGAVSRLMVLAAAGKPITLLEAEHAIRDLVKPPEEKIVKIEAIQAACARHFRVSRRDIVSARRTANIVRPRQVAMYLAKLLTPRSLPEIGRMFGGRDHTTVLHAARKIGNLRETDPELAAEIEAIQREIIELS